MSVRPQHGFDRNGSHGNDEYTCTCGYSNCWQADAEWAFAEIERLVKEKATLWDEVVALRRQVTGMES